MKNYGIIILAIIVLAVVIYVTFIIAVIKITLGLLILGISGLILWFLWNKINDKAEDKF